MSFEASTPGVAGVRAVMGGDGALEPPPLADKLPSLEREGGDQSRERWLS